MSFEGPVQPKTFYDLCSSVWEAAAGPDVVCFLGGFCCVWQPRKKEKHQQQTVISALAGSSHQMLTSPRLTCFFDFYFFFFKALPPLWSIQRCSHPALPVLDNVPVECAGVCDMKGGIETFYVYVIEARNIYVSINGDLLVCIYIVLPIPLYL